MVSQEHHRSTDRPAEGRWSALSPRTRGVIVSGTVGTAAGVTALLITLTPPFTVPGGVLVLLLPAAAGTGYLVGTLTPTGTPAEDSPEGER